MQMQVMGDMVRKGTGGGKIPARCLLDLLKVGYVFVKVDEGRSIIWISITILSAGIII